MRGTEEKKAISWTADEKEASKEEGGRKSDQLGGR